MSLRLIIVLLSILLCSSCSSFNNTPVEDVLGTNKNLIKLAYKLAEDLEDKAFPPLIPMNPDQPILMTTFVDNNDLSRTSRFSLILQEHMASKFVQDGFTVKEIKLRENLQILPTKGETMLSRDLTLIRNSQDAQAVMLGTYSHVNMTMYISARLVDPVTANILSSTDYKLIMDANVLAMLGLQVDNESNDNLINPPRRSFLNWVFY